MEEEEGGGGAYRLYAPKRPVNAFLIYQEECTDVWNNAMTDEEKEPYFVQYRLRKQAYDHDLRINYKTVPVVNKGLAVIPKTWTTVGELYDDRNSATQRFTRFDGSTDVCMLCRKVVGKERFLQFCCYTHLHYMHQVCVDDYMANKRFTSYFQTCPYCIKTTDKGVELIGEDEVIPNLFPMSLAVFKAIKTYRFVFKNFPGIKCGLCDTVMEYGDDYKRFRCGHYFHPACIDDFVVNIRYNNPDDICPSCNNHQV